MDRKILITDDVHPVLPHELDGMGYECELQPDFSTDEVNAVIEKYYGIIVNSKIRVDKTMMDRAACLKFIGRAGSGMETIDAEYAQQKGITCINSPEGNRDAVAEHIIAMLLCLLNNIVRADKEMRERIWKREPNRGTELKGKTIGIIGYGNTGSALAEKLRGFGVNVLAYDKYKTGFRSEAATEATMNEIFDKADIVSLHLPLSSETRYMADEIFFSSFTKSIYFINAARGQIVKTRALLHAMEKGKVTGACLDVFEKEKLDELTVEEDKIFQQLIESGKVILTPHIAGWTHESKEKTAKILAEKIREFSYAIRIS